MSKKVYHIVDPETGEVVAKKKVGKLGQKYYQEAPKDRLSFMLLMIFAFLMLLSLLLMLMIFLLPIDWREYIVIPFLVVFLLIIVTARVYNRITKNEKE